jgi:hypothetical protein
LHTVLSAQDVPFVTLACWQPATGSQLSVVHALLSLQLSAVPAAQKPLWQVSAPLHTVASAHDVPFASTVFWQLPALHTSAVHGLLSLQLAFVVHDRQLGIGVFVQPLTGLQESAVHALPSSQLSAVPAVHVPLWQVSAPLHTVPSAHEVPLARLACRQPVTGSQLSVVHALLSLQLSAVPAVHAPLWQLSAPLHTVASAQEVPFTTGVCVHPKTGSQLSVVQTLKSLQVSAVPGVQMPP